MRIDEDRCIACLDCIDHCPVGAIKEGTVQGEVFIDQDECVECDCCLRADVCGSDAIWQPELVWPRILRAQFSNPVWIHPSTGLKGRGIEEIKTNEVRGRYRRGQIGVAAELGRPGVGAYFRDVERVLMAIVPLGITFDKDTPIYSLMSNPETGKLKEEILGERVLSAIIDFSTTPEKLSSVLKSLHEVSQQIETVFSVDMCSLLDPDGTCPAERIAEADGFVMRPNGKNNVGLGRPLAEL
ncbi:indolepyruvate ferredoxin oxidoreductase subunit alpha [Chloroflexota bacterium]